MFHDKRIWTISDAENTEELAEKLVNHTWCACNGFRLGGYLFLNDSMGPDGAQEYGIIRECDGAQLESITFSWCTPKQALNYIRAAINHTLKTTYARVDLQARIDTNPDHTCGACA